MLNHYPFIGTYLHITESPAFTKCCVYSELKSWPLHINIKIQNTMKIQNTQKTAKFTEDETKHE